MNSTFDWSSLKQLNISQIVLAFFLPSGIALFGFRFVLPGLVDSGYPKILMWGVIGSLMLLGLVIIGLLLVKKEAKAHSISIVDRLLIKQISIKHWLICLGIMISGIVLSTLISPTVEYFKELPGLAIPEYMPFWLDPAVNPMNSNMDILSPNYPLKGNYVVLIIMSVTLILNILAEEIYFRGWLLPKMQKLGRWSWVVNGILFALYHTFQLWLFPMLIVISLATSLSVYFSRSILPAFAIHIVANFLLSIVGIIMLVIS